MSKPNHAWRNLWVPLVLAVAVGVGFMMNLLTATQAIGAASTLAAIFALMAVIGLVIHTARSRQTRD